MQRSSRETTGTMANHDEKLKKACQRILPEMQEVLHQEMQEVSE